MTRRILALGLAALLVALAPPGLNARESGKSSVPFDFYVLSLSWSPTYCLAYPGDRAQCGGKGYGFVLHGLWPQYARGGYPEFCASRARMTPEAIGFAATIFPSPKLIRHEWDKHGTCSGMDALHYFETADRARTSLQVPPALDAPARPLNLTAGQIVSAFVQANPGLPEDSLVVRCSGPELAEVRVCLDPGLAPRGCDNAVRSNCRRGTLRIPAVR